MRISAMKSLSHICLNSFISEASSCTALTPRCFCYLISPPRCVLLLYSCSRGRRLETERVLSANPAVTVVTPQGLCAGESWDSFAKSWLVPVKCLPGSALTGKLSTHIKTSGCMLPFVLNSRSIHFVSWLRICSGAWEIWQVTAFGFFQGYC